MVLVCNIASFTVKFARICSKLPWRDICQRKIQSKLSQSDHHKVTTVKNHHASVPKMCSANTIEKTHGRSSKPLRSTVNDKLLTFEQLLWCDWRQMDRGTPTCLLRFNLCSPCSKKIERDDPVFQFWRATAHKYDKFEGLYILYLNSVRCWYALICFCRKHMVKLHIPANLPLMWDQQSYTLHSFQILSAFYWLHFQLACLDPIYEILRPAFPSFTPSSPNTKPLPLQARFCY